MKTSLEWLQEYADINVPIKELADILTMTGTKVETIEEKGKDIKNVVVGKILEIEKHPDADKLVVTKVDVGNEKLQIVTGASNIKVGDIVPIAKDGSELPGDVKIKCGQLREIDSCGMMCSVGELGLNIEDYQNQIEHGIMILSNEYEKYLGEDITKVLGLREDIIDFEITPNRQDCYAVEGIGRETAVSLNENFKNPHKNLDELKVPNKSEIEGVKVDILAPDLCYRYIARVVKNVQIKESPDWMKRRLKACNVRSINNIVDITNYVMLEMGQPMHAFDINTIKGKHIIVRRAKNGEKITTLDEEEKILNEDMLVIADEEKPVAVAGVKGGLDSGIKEDTNTIVFESAVFNAGSVRITAKNIGLRTEASSRYEKGLAPENAMRAINRAIELVEKLGIGEVVEGAIDIYPTKQKINKVPFDPERINKLLGTNIEPKVMKDIFEKLNLKLEGNMLEIPYYRTDIEQEADIAEEVIRFYGYDKLDSTLIKEENTLGYKNKFQKMEDEIKALLVDQGFSEIYTYPFIHPRDLKKINVNDDKGVITIMSPLNEDYSIMRPTTIASMMQTVSTNYAQKNKNVKLYEFGRVYKDLDNLISNNKLPTETKMLTIGAYGDNLDFYNMKGYVEEILQKVNIKRYEIVREENNTSYHPGKTAKVKIGQDVIVTFGEVHPIVTQNYQVGEKVFIGEINLDKLVVYSREDKKYTPIPKYPAVERDIAVIIDEEIEAGAIERIIQKRAKKVLEEIELFDIYRNEKLGVNKKSLAYSLKFRDNNKTLTDDEITGIMNSIIKDLEIELNAELRK